MSRWNPDDPGLLTRKAVGWGLDLNVYWIFHRRLARARRRRR
jgi:hypothetical protein